VGKLKTKKFLSRVLIEFLKGRRTKSFAVEFGE
jgi:hypothetical protein